MPQLIEFLDKIARAKQRDVLSIRFLDSSMELDEILEIDFDQYKPFTEGHVNVVHGNTSRD